MAFFSTVSVVGIQAVSLVGRWSVRFVVENLALIYDDDQEFERRIASVGKAS